MKVLLLYPSHKRGLFNPSFLKLTEGRATAISDSQDYPLPFAYMGAQLLQNGHVVKVIDMHSFNLRLEQVKRDILLFRPDIIGIQSDFRWECPIPSTYHVKLVLEQLKTLGLDFKTILMGPQGTIHPEEELKNLPVDIVVKGEEEFIFPQVIENLDSLEKVKGISYKEGGEIVHNPISSYGDFDKLPLPAYDLLNLNGYFLEPMGELWNFPKMQFFHVDGSRGCPFQCTFCFKITYSRLYRPRPLDKLLTELEMLKIRGVEFVGFTDGTFNLNNERVLDICSEMTNRNLNMKWTCLIRPELVKEETIKEMAKAGCTIVMAGMESGSDKILENAKKGYTTKEIKDGIMTCKKYVKTSTFVCKFLPGETKETLKQTVSFLKEVNPFWIGQVLATPIPGTELFTQGLQEGTLKNDNWLEVLNKAGMVGNNGYSREYIDKMSDWFSIQIAKFRATDLKNVWTYMQKSSDPRKLLRYLNFGLKIIRSDLTNFQR